MKKLSEMNSVEISNALVRIVEPMERLIKDEEVRACFGQIGKMLRENTSMMGFYGNLMMTVIPVLLGEKHMDDTFGVIAGLKGVSVEDVKAQSGVEMLGETVSMLLGDGGVMSIFRSIAQMQSQQNPGDAVQTR